LHVLGPFRGSVIDGGLHLAEPLAVPALFLGNFAFIQQLT